MSFSRAVLCATAVTLSASRAAAAAAPQDTLDTAERIRATDKPAARKLLDSIERDPAALNDPRLVARMQLLECTWSDTPAQAYAAVAKGLAAAERARDAALQARLTGCRANALVVDGRTLDGERAWTAAVSLAHDSGDKAVEAEMLGNLGYAQYARGAMADALANVQAAYRLNSLIGNHKLVLEDLSIIANVYADGQVAQYDRAIEYYRQLLAEYEKLGQRSDVGDTLFNIGSTYERKNDLKAAELHYRRALAIFEQLRRADDIAYTQRSLASALTKEGRAGEALPLLDAAVAHYERTRSIDSLASARQFRGIAYRRAGRPADALRELDFARRHYEEQHNTRFLEKNVEETAAAYAQLGDWKNAYQAAARRQALQDQLAAARRDELSSRLRVEFDSEKKEQENRSLERENTLRAAALHQAQKNDKLQIAVIVLTVMLAIALAILFWRTRTMAMTDELTRLPNRRRILAAAGSTLGAAKRGAREAAVIVLDIDRFKWINDTFGHGAGDAVLRAVARACQEQLRAGDQIGRIGGEEFLVVLDSATAAQARDVAERLRSAVERLDLSAIAANLRVTISLGVHVTTDTDPAAAIAAADSLLYRAKEGGRNRVEMEA